MKTITVRPNEEGMLAITVAYKDHAGTAVTPATMAWKLTDVNGSVVNSRSSVAVGSLAATNTIVLNGDDLPTNGSDRPLLCTFQGTYNHAIGSALNIKESVRFWVDNLVVVS